MTADIRIADHPLNDSWYWSVLDRYRDASGRTLIETEFDWVRSSGLPMATIDDWIAKHGWQWSPKPAQAVDRLIQLIEAFRHPAEPFTYLEFGACWSTTMAGVLRHFKQAMGIGLEQLKSRYEIGSWLLQEMAESFGFAGRFELRNEGFMETNLAPASVDVVLMDTNHIYPDDYEYVMHLLGSGVLRPGALFVGDDPEHTGTKKARERFIAEHGAQYHVITRSDWNLWWFCIGDRTGEAIPAHTDRPAACGAG